MVDIMFSAASRLMRIVGGFACAPRKSARIPLNVTVLDHVGQPNPRRLSLTMPGWLKDVSETGLGMVVPTIRVGDRYITGVDRRLSIALELAGGPLKLTASPVRYEQIEANGGASLGYLIGARIMEMSDGDRLRLTDYLKTLP
jgi:hypothetical protein